MFYKLTYANNNTSLSKELTANAEEAEQIGWGMIADHENLGSVIIERRQSEYYGDYKHVVTISKSKPDPNSQTSSVKAAFSDYKPSNNARWYEELHPFKQYRLDEEEADLRRLIWICSVKKLMLPNGQLRAEYNAKRDEQISILRANGRTYEEIADKAEFYECWNEFVSN